MLFPGNSMKFHVCSWKGKKLNGFIFVYNIVFPCFSHCAKTLGNILQHSLSIAVVGSSIVFLKTEPNECSASAKFRGKYHHNSRNDSFIFLLHLLTNYDYNEVAVRLL